MKFFTVADEAYKFYPKTISLGGWAPPSLVVYGPIDLLQKNLQEHHHHFCEFLILSSITVVLMSMMLLPASLRVYFI